MRKYLIALITLLFYLNLRATVVDSIYSKANAFYQKNDYQNAIKEYEEIIQEGFESPEVYFNLGNAYYKTNDYASAILNYERAKRLAPDDEDILFNLKLANLNVIDKVEPIPPFFMKAWWNNLADLFNVNEWAIVNIVLLTLTVLAGILFLMSASGSLKKILFFIAAIFLVSFGLSFSLAQTRNNIQSNSNEAIVFAPSSYIKSSPSDKSIDLFILHEGTKVKILDAVGDWRKIRLANGEEGWILGKDVKVI
jgi:tetratricopeptide (TPR) repeat protein